MRSDWAIRPPTIRGGEKFAPGVVRIDVKSKGTHQDAVGKIAKFLAAERGYGIFTSRHSWGADAVAYAMTDLHFTKRGTCSEVIVGVAYFTKTDYEVLGIVNELAWVWVHPFARGRENPLQRLWPLLREKHGLFWIQTPVSSALSRFVKRVDPAHAAWIREQTAKVREHLQERRSS